MDEIRQSLTSGSWWFSVVLAGIVVNILAVVMKTGLDSWLSKLSSKRQIAVEQRKAEQTQTVAALKSDPYQQLMFDLREVKALITGVLYAVFGQILIVAAAVMNLRDLLPRPLPRTALGAGWDVLIAYALGAVLLLMGMISLRDAVMRGFVLRQARSDDKNAVREVTT